MTPGWRGHRRVIRGERINSTGLTIHKKSRLSTFTHTRVRASAEHQTTKLCARNDPGVTVFELAFPERKPLCRQDFLGFLARKFAVDTPRHITRGKRRSIRSPLQALGYGEDLSTRERTTAEQHEAKDDTE